jgi:hypothetical protein
MPSRCIVDSNSYFRLAKSIHPLLGVEFGAECHCLHVLVDLDVEFSKSRRLSTKFAWVGEQEFVENRSANLIVPARKRKEVTIAEGFFRHHSRQRQLGLSFVDIRVLATAHAFGMELVTDDEAVLDVADVFSVSNMNSMELLKLMVDCEHIKIAKVRQMAAYWVHEKDCPGGFRQDCQRLFGGALV